MEGPFQVPQGVLNRQQTSSVMLLIETRRCEVIRWTCSLEEWMLEKEEKKKI